MMSTELESPQSSISISQKKKKDKHATKKPKKRKPTSRENGQSPAPIQSHRSTHHSNPPKATHVSAAPSASLDDSPFYEQTYSLFLPLSPICYRHPLQGLCAEHLSPLILSYYPPFQGVILSYCNTRLSTDPAERSGAENLGPILAKSVDEYAVSFVWITADFLVFRPRRHNFIEGWVNLQNQGNLGLVCWNFFNVSIDRRRLPKGWTWVPHGLSTPAARKHKRVEVGLGLGHDGAEKEIHRNGHGSGEGSFVDENGHKVEGLIRFRVTNVETSRSADRENGFISIEGTMLDEEEEQRQEQESVSLQKRTSKSAVQPSGHEYLMHGALVSNSVDGMNGFKGINETDNSKHIVNY